jgi:hypothetical protein
MIGRFMRVLLTVLIGAMYWVVGGEALATPYAAWGAAKPLPGRSERGDGSQDLEKTLDKMVDNLCNFSFDPWRELDPDYLALLGDITTSLPPARLYRDFVDHLILFHTHDRSRYEHFNLENVFYLKLPRNAREGFKEFLQREMMAAYRKVSERAARIGLKPPQGLIYVWLLRKRGEMEEIFKPVLSGSEGVGRKTMAFAFGCRHVVIPYDFIPPERYVEMIAGSSGGMVDLKGQRETLREGFTAHFAHELVHTFVNSSAGLKKKDLLPKWFHEGLAVSLVGGGGEDMTPQYREFGRIFNYVRARYGREKHLAFIQRSIRDGSVEGGLKDVLGLGSEGELFEKSRSWYTFQRSLGGVFSVLGAVALGFVVRGWWTRKGIALPLMGFVYVVLIYLGLSGFVGFLGDGRAEKAALWALWVVLLAGVPFVFKGRVIARALRELFSRT